MCNSTEPSGVDLTSDSREGNGFTLESDLLFLCANTADSKGNAGDNVKESNSYPSSLVNDSCCRKVLGTAQTLEQSSTSTVADVIDISKENGIVDTLLIDKEIMFRPEMNAINREKLKKGDVQATRGKEMADSLLSSQIFDAISGQTPDVVEVRTSIFVPGGQDPSAEATQEALKGAKDLEMLARMQHSHNTEANNPSVAASEYHSAGRPCPDLEQKVSTLKHDASSSQEVNSLNEESPKGLRDCVTCIDEKEGTTSTMTGNQPMATVTLIASGSQAGAEQSESKTVQSRHMMEIVVTENKGMSTPVTTSSSEELAIEHGQKKLEDFSRDSSAKLEQDDTDIPSIPQIVQDLHTEGNNGPELAEFFCNARGYENEVEMEEQDHVSARIKSPPRKESPRSLRMLLFSEETALLAKKDEKNKRDGKGMEFSSKVVPAFEGLDENQNKNFNFPKWHEYADNVEESNGFSGPLAFSGTLNYQGLIGPAAYSGNISHRSDSSTSTRSFAFPILASEWNTSPVKMGAPDPRFFRQQRKWHLCYCCKHPSTLFD